MRVSRPSAFEVFLHPWRLVGTFHHRIGSGRSGANVIVARARTRSLTFAIEEKAIIASAVKMAEGLGLLPAQDFVDKLDSH
jgi:hypothetical protein